MIETASAFIPALAPAGGAFRDAATLLFPGPDSKSGADAETGARRLPTEIIQRSASAVRKAGAGADALTEEEKAEVAGLKRRDAETRRHEQAHATAGGPYAGAPSYTYERGPDGRSYAVAGSTPIDVSPISGDPSATVRKMETVKRAALAPTEPSAQDRKVAAQAETEMRAARAEATAQSTSELTGETGPRRAGAVAPPAKSPVEPPGKSPGQSLFAAYGGGGGAGRQPDVSALLDLIA